MCACHEMYALPDEGDHEVEHEDQPHAAHQLVGHHVATPAQVAPRRRGRRRRRRWRPRRRPSGRIVGPGDEHEHRARQPGDEVQQHEADVPMMRSRKLPTTHRAHMLKSDVEEVGVQEHRREQAPVLVVERDARRARGRRSRSACSTRRRRRGAMPEASTISNTNTATLITTRARVTGVARDVEPSAAPAGTDLAARDHAGAARAPRSAAARTPGSGSRPARGSCTRGRSAARSSSTTRPSRGRGGGSSSAPRGRRAWRCSKSAGMRASGGCVPPSLGGSVLIPPCLPSRERRQTGRGASLAGAPGARSPDRPRRAAWSPLATSSSSRKTS